MHFMKNNSWVIVLGGSSGMGLASAKKLAQKGFSEPIFRLRLLKLNLKK